MGKADNREDLLLFTSSLAKTQRLQKMLCAIKKLMVEESAWTFQLQKGPILLHLVFTWVDLLIKETAVAAVVVAAVIVMTIEVIVEAAGVADTVVAVTDMAAVDDAMTTEVTVEAAEIVVDHLPHTVAKNAGVHAPDLTHLAVIKRNGRQTIKNKTSSYTLPITVFHTVLQTIFYYERAIMKK